MSKSTKEIHTSSNLKQSEYRGHTLIFISGSDSGISMSSQDVQDMVELLKLPFDMPKLRRKTQHILRPASMPINDIALRYAKKSRNCFALIFRKSG